MKEATLCVSCDWWYSGVCCNKDAEASGKFVDRKNGCKLHKESTVKPAYISILRGAKMASCPRCDAPLTYDELQTKQESESVCFACGNAYRYPAVIWPGYGKIEAKKDAEPLQRPAFCDLCLYQMR